MKIIFALMVLFLPGILAGLLKSYLVHTRRRPYPALILFWVLVVSVSLIQYNEPIHPHADFGLITILAFTLLFSTTNAFAHIFTTTSAGLFIKRNTEFWR
jgi:hypothetical protein